MSDHSEAAGCSDMFRGSEIRRPQDPHQLQWMGHWKHINYTCTPSIHRNPADNAVVHKEECTRGGQSLLAQCWKSKQIGIGNRQMPDHGASPVISGSLHSVEGMIAGNGAINITKNFPGMENTRAFEAKRMIVSKTSVCRMEKSCVDCKNVGSSPLLHSGIVSSEWQRYAEFNVNQKTQSVVRSKRKYGCWDARLDRGQLQTTRTEFASATDEVKSVPEEFQFQGEYMVRLSRLFRFSEKRRLPSSRCLQNDCMGSMPSYEPGRFSQMPDSGPPVFTGEENVHSISGITYKEKLANHKHLNMENEICEPCNCSMLTFSQKKRDEKLIMGCSWPMPRDQSPKAHGDSPVDASDSQLLLTKRSSMQGFMELSESFCEQHFQRSVPGFSMHKLGRHTTVDSICRPLGISINDEKEGCRSVDECSTDAAGLDIDAHRVNSLPEGVTSARSDKKDFIGMQNPRKSGSTSALQMKEAIISNQETKLPAASMDFSPCIGRADTVDAKGLSTSRTDTMEVERIFSEVEKPEKSSTSHQPENHLGTEVSSRWVKRLKVNSDSVAIGTTEYNMEDASTTQRVHKLFSRVMNYSRSNSFTMAKCLQECKQFQKTMLLLRNNDSPVESLKESHPWIQRWCQKCEETVRPKARKPIEVLCEPEKTNPLPENLEGKLFPSLSAMALMGKAINNFRPCEFRRRGSSLVWNTEGF